MPVIEKRGPWIVVVVTDSKGQIFAYPWKGTEPEAAPQAIEDAEPDAGTRYLVHWERGLKEAAPQAIEDAEPDAGTRYLVHWERGLKTRQDTEIRAREVNAEIQSETGTSNASNTTIVKH